MKKKELHFFKDYLSNLQVDVNTAEYTQCWDTWSDYDYTPSYNKFYFICDGEGWLKIDGKEFYPKPGQLFLMPAGVLQSYSGISDRPFKKYWCHFTAKVGDMNLFDIIDAPFFIDIPDCKKLEGMFKELILNHESDRLVDLIKGKAVMMNIIAPYLENSFDEHLTLFEGSSTEKLNTLIQYIHENISANITIERMAGIVHFHPNYFIKFFRKHMGISPIQYISKA